MPDTETVYIGLGSNLEHPRRQLQRAIEALEQLPDTNLIAVSSWYRSAPVGPAGQPDYLNAVARLETTLDPESLLNALQGIEQQQGRQRGERWAARTLDLDILLFGEHIIKTPRLQIPHAQMGDRNFVLVPLAELAGKELMIPGNGVLEEALAKCPDNALERLEPESS